MLSGLKQGEMKVFSKESNVATRVKKRTHDRMSVKPTVTTCPHDRIRTEDVATKCRKAFLNGTLPILSMRIFKCI